MSKFEDTRRVAIACSGCREVKCLTNSTKEACMRCQKRGLRCKYVPPDKQPKRTPALESGSRSRGHHHNPGSSSNPHMTSGGSEAHNNPGSQRHQYRSAAAPSTGDSPYTSPTSGRGSVYYSQQSQPFNDYHPSMPASYGGQTQYYTPNDPGNMQPLAYTGYHLPQSAGYPTEYHNYTFEWNSSNPPSCVCPPTGPCYCGLRIG
ncbi:hypothetical protein R3P38DRAFT_2763292 [Favolaschia claudopus]|uniref:Zn(2)-C6 fungal-type domain-containing protein n=1 Tax=Favolaschia claudopus TaxID=2862362 RepID=A0AAW0DBX5_9AGAR